MSKHYFLDEPTEPTQAEKTAERKIFLKKGPVAIDEIFTKKWCWSGYDRSGQFIVTVKNIKGPGEMHATIEATPRGWIGKKNETRHL